MKNKLFSFKSAVLSAFAILSLGVIVLAPRAQADMHENPGTIVDIALGDENFSTLVQAVVKADLVEVLSGKRQFTVFAPTDEAFDAAATALGYADGMELVEALDVATLTDILLYHVAPGERLAADVVESSRIRTMNKSFLFFNPEDTSLVGVGSTAGIVAVDIIADNGVIHVIDFVLLPFGI